MRKPFFQLLMIALFSVGCWELVHAQETSPAAKDSDQLTSAVAGSESFADIAVLSQQIAISQRKIQAMELKNSLATLEAQQLTGTFPFKVVRIEGFGDTLYAVLSDDAGVLYQVGPGDLIASQYRVSLIRPSSVGVYDINAHRAYAVPFVLGGQNTSDVQEAEFSSDVASSPAVATAAVAKQTATSS